MKRNALAALLLAGAALIGLTGCANEDDDALKSKVTGTWRFDADKTAYSSGLLLDLSGQAEVIDTAMVLETVSSLFSDSEIKYNIDTTGYVKKNVLETTASDSTSLAGILNGLAGQLIRKDFTYKAASGKITMKMGTSQYTFTVISITDTQMNVAMPLTDLTKWISGMLGDKVSNITESPIYTGITQVAAIIGVFASPTVTMTFDKIPDPQ